MTGPAGPMHINGFRAPDGSPFRGALLSGPRRSDGRIIRAGTFGTAGAVRHRGLSRHRGPNPPVFSGARIFFSTPGIPGA